MRILEIISEEISALPDNSKKLHLLKQLMQKPIAAKHGVQALHSIIFNSEIEDLLTTLSDEDPSQDIRQPFVEYLQTAYPEIGEMFIDREPMARDDNIDGTLSPLGHKAEN